MAELLKQTRRRHGVSQRTLALRAGTDQGAISRIERGQVSPSIETVERLLAAMGEGWSLRRRRWSANTTRFTCARRSSGRPPSDCDWLSLGTGWRQI